MLAWFIDAGKKVFAPDTWHRVPFQPILFFFMWLATLHIIFTLDNDPIRFELLTSYAGVSWIILSLICPVLVLCSWWFIKRSQLPWSTFFGMWLRLVADIGQFTVLIVYYIVILLGKTTLSDGEIYLRFITVSCLIFCLLLVIRDIWALVLTEKVANLLWSQKENDDG